MSRTSPGGVSTPAQEEPEPANRLDLSSVQIGASALSAVTAAVGASFFGVGGTISGAAFGAVVSTVAGAVYTHSLRTAGDRLKQAQVKVRQVPAATAGRSPAVPPPELQDRRGASPATAPGGTAARRGEDLTRPTTVAAPVPAPAEDEDLTAVVQPDATTLRDPEATRLLRPDVAGRGDQAADPTHVVGPADSTRLMPPVEAVPTYADHEAPAGVGGGERVTQYGRPARPVYKRKPAILLAAISLAGFALALGLVTVGESLIGKPLSVLFGSTDDDGSGGTSLGRLGGSSSTDGTSDDATPAPTDEDTEQSTDEPTEEPTQEPTSQEESTPREEPTSQDQPADRSTDGPGNGQGQGPDAGST